jgi:hypothetical protein
MGLVGQPVGKLTEGRIGAVAGSHMEANTKDGATTKGRRPATKLHDRLGNKHHAP